MKLSKIFDSDAGFRSGKKENKSKNEFTAELNVKKQSICGVFSDIKEELCQSLLSGKNFFAFNKSISDMWDEMWKSVKECCKVCYNPERNWTGCWEKVVFHVGVIDRIVSLDPVFVYGRITLGIEEEEEDRLVHHLIHTACIMAEVVGHLKDIPCSKEELIGAALIHDVGYIPLGLRFEISEENEKFKTHPLVSKQIAEKMGAPNLIQRMVVEHHESKDGSGYPHGLRGDEIFYGTQILILCERFERIRFSALRKAREGNGNLENYVLNSLKELKDRIEDRLLKEFISIYGIYPNGMVVELNNRYICMVLKQNFGKPIRPVVQVIVDSSGNHPDELQVIDLSKNSELAITRIITSPFGVK